MLGRLFGRGASKTTVDEAGAGASEPSQERSCVTPPQLSWYRVTAVTACSLPVGEGGASTSFVAVAEAPSHRVMIHVMPGAAVSCGSTMSADSTPTTSVDLTATILANASQRLPCRCTPHFSGERREAPVCPFCWSSLAFVGGTAKSGLLAVVAPASFAILDVARGRAVMSCGAISSVEPGVFEPTRFFTGIACPPALRYVLVGTQVRGGDDDDGDDNEDASALPSAVVDEAVATRVVELMADEVDRPMSMAMPPLSSAAAVDDDDEEEHSPTMAVWEGRWVRRHVVRVEPDVRARRCFVSRRRAAVEQMVTWPRDHSVAFSLVTDDDTDASGSYEHNKRMVVVASSTVVGGCITAEFQMPSARSMGRRSDLMLSAGTDAVMMSYCEEQIGVSVIVGWDLTAASHASVAGDLAAQYFVKNRADRSPKRTCAFEVRPPSWSMSVDLTSVALRVQVPRRCRPGPSHLVSSPPPPSSPDDMPAAAAGFDAGDCSAASGAAATRAHDDVPVEGVVVEGTVVEGEGDDVVPVERHLSTPSSGKQSAPLPPLAAQSSPPPPAVEFDEQIARNWRLAALLPVVATSMTPGEPAAAAAGLNALVVSPLPSFVSRDDGDAAAAANPNGDANTTPHCRQWAAVVVSIERPGRVLPLDSTLSVGSMLLPEGAGAGCDLAAARKSHFVQDATDDAAGTSWWWCSAQTQQQRRGAGAAPGCPIERIRQGAPHLEWAAPTALPVCDGDSRQSQQQGFAKVLRAKPIPRPHEEPSVALLAAIHPVLHRVWAPLPRLAISAQDVEKGIKASRGVGAALGRVFGGGGDKKSAKEAPAASIEANHTMLTEHAGRIAATLAFVESSLPEHDDVVERPGPPRQPQPPSSDAAPAAPVASAAVVPAARGGFKIPPTSKATVPAGKEEDFDSWVARTVAPTLPSDGARAKLLAGTTARESEPESRLDQYRRNKALKAEMNETKNAMNEAQERLHERGERIDELGERTAEMDQHAGNFAAAAAAYRKQQQNKKWWQL